MSTNPGTKAVSGHASEVKVPAPAARAAEILAWVRAHTEPDPHGGGDHGDLYRVTSLYLDTDQFDVFRRHGSYGRSKYRIRRYDQSDQVFLERKLRVGSKVSKRRSAVGMEDLSHLRNGAGGNGWPGDWFHRRLLVRRLHPVCGVAYRRVARMALTSEGLLRITMDRDIQAFTVSTPSFADVAEPLQIAPECIIVELKYQNQMPALFKWLIEDLALDPQPFSKYRLAASELGLVGEATSDSKEVRNPFHA